MAKAPSGEAAGVPHKAGRCLSTRAAAGGFRAGCSRIQQRGKYLRTHQLHSPTLRLRTVHLLPLPSHPTVPLKRQPRSQVCPLPARPLTFIDPPRPKVRCKQKAKQRLRGQAPAGGSPMSRTRPSDPCLALPPHPRPVESPTKRISPRTAIAHGQGPHRRWEGDGELPA